MTYQDPDKKEKEDNASAEDAPEASAPAYPLGKPSEGKPSKEEKPEKTNKQREDEMKSEMVRPLPEGMFPLTCETCTT